MRHSRGCSNETATQPLGGPTLLVACSIAAFRSGDDAGVLALSAELKSWETVGDYFAGITTPATGSEQQKLITVPKPLKLTL
jgi:hypothetical protein